MRLSAMGDIVYTTPIVRCLKQQLPHTAIHFLIKKDFQSIYAHNPYVDKLHLLKENLPSTIKDIQAEQFDCLIDLHNNLRTNLIKWRTRIKTYTFKKATLKKYLALIGKWTPMSRTHLVDHYFKTVAPLGVYNDQKPIDYYLPTQQPNLEELLPASHRQQFVAFIIGASYPTKRMPNPKIISICKRISKPIVLLGGADVQPNGHEIAQAIGNKIYNACGRTTLDESVYLVSKAWKVIGFDTGLTHITEAFNKDTVSIWGSTDPYLLGVQPYQSNSVLMMGVTLPCRPCSKFGLEKCPSGHFQCMWNIPEGPIIEFINRC